MAINIVRNGNGKPAFISPHENLNIIEGVLLRQFSKLPPNGFIKKDLPGNSVCLKWKTKLVRRFKTADINVDLFNKGIEKIQMLNEVEEMVKKTDIKVDYRKGKIIISAESGLEFTDKEFETHSKFIDHLRSAAALYFEQHAAA